MMFNIPYNTERDGQLEFFANYNIPVTNDNSILIDNTDGVYHGILFEFKLNINDMNKVLYQAIKYLSRMRIKGESIPANIWLVDLNKTTVYIHDSNNYITDIQKVYIGAASKNNAGFSINSQYQTLNYSNQIDSARLRKLLILPNDTNWYIPIDIDENCILGWAERYYRECPKATKGDFLGDETGTAVQIKGEIRKPQHFKGLINPYLGSSNEKFKYLMDCLNDRLSKKELGAFYTPPLYAQQAAALIKQAISRVPEGNDYVIIDRCAGTGNLQAELLKLKDKNGDDIISHCIVSTYEYYEYKVLQERLGDVVREIIPPTEANVNYKQGKICNADALSENFINNPIIKQYLDNKKCSIILLENPPYSDSSGDTHIKDGDKTQRAATDRQETYILKEFKKALKNELRSIGGQQAVARELANLFIWSGFRYYLRQPSDSYILFSPVKYYKNTHLIQKKFIDGYAFNREHFHATKSVVSCILWSNENDSNNTSIILKTYDIENNKITTVTAKPEITVNQVCKEFTEYADKREDKNDIESDTGIAVVGSDGYEITYTFHKGRRPKYNPNIIGYLVAKSYMIDPKHYNLVRTNFDTALKNAYGFWLRNDNFLQKLPLFVAKLLPIDKWYDKDIYSTTSDGGNAYCQDDCFLKSCLIYTCLSNKNKCISFRGSDGRFYENELCLIDKSYKNTITGLCSGTIIVNSASPTLALQELVKFMTSYSLDQEEQKLLSKWDNILTIIQKLPKFNKTYSYNPYQIDKEINTFTINNVGRNPTKQYDYPALNGALTTLKIGLKEYYLSHIKEKMFTYSLIK